MPPDHPNALSAQSKHLVLVGGPFDGDTMAFRPEQTAIVVPESIDGALHRYEVAADGRAHFAAKVPEEQAERLARLLYEHYVEEVSDGDPENWNPWEILDDEERSYSLNQARWLLERGLS